MAYLKMTDLYDGNFPAHLMRGGNWGSTPAPFGWSGVGSSPWGARGLLGDLGDLLGLGSHTPTETWALIQQIQQLAPQVQSGASSLVSAVSSAKAQFPQADSSAIDGIPSQVLAFPALATSALSAINADAGFGQTYAGRYAAGAIWNTQISSADFDKFTGPAGQLQAAVSQIQTYKQTVQQWVATQQANFKAASDAAAAANAATAKAASDAATATKATTDANNKVDAAVMQATIYSAAGNFDQALAAISDQTVIAAANFVSRGGELQTAVAKITVAKQQAAATAATAAAAGAAAAAAGTPTPASSSMVPAPYGVQPSPGYLPPTSAYTYAPPPSPGYYPAPYSSAPAPGYYPPAAPPPSYSYGPGPGLPTGQAFEEEPDYYAGSSVDQGTYDPMAQAVDYDPNSDTGMSGLFRGLAGLGEFFGLGDSVSDAAQAGTLLAAAQNLETQATSFAATGNAGLILQANAFRMQAAALRQKAADLQAPKPGPAAPPPATTATTGHKVAKVAVYGVVAYVGYRVLKKIFGRKSA